MSNFLTANPEIEMKIGIYYTEDGQSHPVTVTFSNHSRIHFHDEAGETLIISMDPTDLTALYGAYRQMLKEDLENEKNQKL